MRFRKIAMIATSILVTATALIGASCKTPGEGTGNGGNGGGDTPATAFISLDHESLDLTLGDAGALVASYLKQAGKVLTFTSSNDGVVTVDNKGNLLAIAEGSATITAEYAGLTDTCVVKVVLSGNVPTLQLPYVPYESVELANWSQLDLNGEVLFNKSVYTDATFEYALSDSSVGTMENGVFTPSKVGTTEIAIKGTWRGKAYKTLEKTITVTVVEK
jgi:hypothetical protein